MQPYSSCALGIMSHCPKTSLGFKPFLREPTQISLNVFWSTGKSPSVEQSCYGCSGWRISLAILCCRSRGEEEWDVPKELWPGQWWTWVLIPRSTQLGTQVMRCCCHHCHPRLSWGPQFKHPCIYIVIKYIMLFKSLSINSNHSIKWLSIAWCNCRNVETETETWNSEFISCCQVACKKPWEKAHSALFPPALAML